MQPVSAVLVYMTAPDAVEATRIARALVEQRLAACANVLGPIESIYWWEGKLEQGGEVAFLAKTTNEKVSALTEQVQELHSYDCPCVVAVPITGGNPGFLRWIADETDSSFL